MIAKESKAVINCVCVCACVLACMPVVVQACAHICVWDVEVIFILFVHFFFVLLKVKKCKYDIYRSVYLYSSDSPATNVRRIFLWN